MAGVAQGEVLERAAAEATRRAEEAEAAKLAAEKAAAVKPAELARTRTKEGTATLEENWDFRIEAFAMIDLDMLRPYIREDHIKQAIGRFVALYKDTRKIPGVEIFKTTKARML